MRIWGKVIGAVIGLLTGGPVGLLMGLFLGHLVDSAVPQLSGIRTLQEAFFSTLFSVMGHLAKADGRVTEQEIAVADAIMSRMRLTRFQRSEAIRLFNLGKQPGFDLGGAVENFYRAAQLQPALRRLMLEILLDAALADGMLKPEGQRVLVQVSVGMAIPEWEFERMLLMRRNARAYQQQYRQQRSARPSQPRVNPYQVLGIESSASEREIKRAYRKLMSQHHPDKLVSQGLPKEMMELAKEKTVQIRAAYDEIRNQRGFR